MLLWLIASISEDSAVHYSTTTDNNMPRSCCVFGCRSNYDKGKPTVTTFSFPSDETRRKQWVKCINRADFQPSSSSVVCIKHFDEKFIIREDKFPCKDGSVITVPRDKLKLTEDSYPTIFENQPKYLTKHLPRTRTTPSERRERLKIQDEHNFNVWCEQNKIASFAAFQIGLKTRSVDPFAVNVNNEFVSFIRIKDSDFFSVPEHIVSFKVSSLLEVKIFHKNMSLPMNTFKWLLGDNLLCDDWTKFDSLITHLAKFDLQELSPEKKVEMSINLLRSVTIPETEDSDTIDKKLMFIVSQLELVFKKQNKYNSDILLWSCKMSYSYPSAYYFLRKSNVLTLPHPSYLKRIICDMGNNRSGIHSSHVAFLKEKLKLLSAHEKIVCLLLDEIYVTPKLSYKGGTLEGRAINSCDNATTLQVFMTSSLLSKNKDVVALFPIKNLNSQVLFDTTVTVLKTLKDVGYNVLCLIADNNKVNRNLFQTLSNNELKVRVPNPVDISQPLFLIFDTVHIIKNVRNNWLNQRDSSQTFCIPNILDPAGPVLKARFSDLKEIYELEKKSCVKLAPSLCQKGLYPTNIERQNVGLALRIFDEKNVVALQQICKNGSERFQGTISFLTLFIKWWKVVNVKHPLKGRNHRDEFCDPIHCVDDKKIQFLLEFSEFLKTWQQLPTPGKLTNETSSALLHTTVALIQISKYLLTECSFKYILLGKIQTDSLEARFGQYRQMSGGNYNVSVRQVLESERKLKILSLLEVKSFKCNKIALKTFVESCNFATNEEQMSAEIVEIFEDVIEESCYIGIDQNSMSVLIFIAGYVGSKAFSKLPDKNCEYCRTNILQDEPMQLELSEEVFEYFSVINRGGLKWPGQLSVDIVFDAFKLFNILISERYEEHFVDTACPRSIMKQLIMQKIAIYRDLDLVCECGIPLVKIVDTCCTTISNILLNNYCKNKNDTQSSSKHCAKKRKVQTFTSQRK